MAETPLLVRAGSAPAGCWVPTSAARSLPSPTWSSTLAVRDPAIPPSLPSLGLKLLLQLIVLDQMERIDSQDRAGRLVLWLGMMGGQGWTPTFTDFLNRPGGCISGQSLQVISHAGTRP